MYDAVAPTVTAVSPAFGPITGNTQVTVQGTNFQAGATVLTLSLKNPVWVRAYIHEPDLGRFCQRSHRRCS